MFELMKKSFLSPTLRRVTNDVLPANSLVSELTSACAIRNNERATRSNVQNVGNSWIFTRRKENPSDCRILEISSNGPIAPLTHPAIQGGSRFDHGDREESGGLHRFFVDF